MSRRLRLANLVLRSFARPLLKRTKTPQRARRDFELTARLFFLGPRQMTEVAWGGVSCLEYRPNHCDGVLLYFHGGGYITGSARSHLPLAGRLAERAGLRAVIPEYRLAPEAPFPAAFEDAVAVWYGLRQAGVAPETIVLAGDSAGGGLALALLAHLLEQGERPASLFAFSPWTDLTLSGASLDENAARDAILPVERIRELRELVAPGSDPADPRLSPLFAEFTGAPPVYLQASNSEILRDDTLRLSERMRNAGVDVTLDLWPDAPHVWQLMAGWLPEADDAVARAAAFAARSIKAPSQRSEN